MDIELNFINESNDTHNTEILFFSQNVPPGTGEAVQAWTVIRNCAVGGHHPFVYPSESTVGYLDGYGNYTRQLPAAPGEAFKAVFTDSGDSIVPNGAADNPQAIELDNALEEDTITALIYKDGRIYTRLASLAPNGKASFVLEPKLWIGTLSHMTPPGATIPITASQANTEISLFGIASADIVMTGGGSGEDPQPFVFKLQNITYV